MSKYVDLHFDEDLAVLLHEHAEATLRVDGGEATRGVPDSHLVSSKQVLRTHLLT